MFYTVYTEGRVEYWMNDVLEEMRKTNRFITKKGIYDYGKERQRPRYVLFIEIQLNFQ